MRNIKNKPSLRFRRFTSTWELHEVKEIFSNIFSGNRLPKNDLIDGEIPYVIAKTNNNGIHKFILKTTLDYHNNEMKLFPSPAITFSIDNPDAIFVQKENFFTSNIMRVLYNPTLNVNHCVFFSEQLKKLTTNFDWSIKFSGPIVHNSSIWLPVYEKKINLDEINEIGKFLLKIDSLSTLYHLKHEKLKQIKKALLENLFPKVGADSPKVRFRGFNDKWKQNEAKKLVSINTGKSNTQDQKEYGIYPFFIRSETPVRSSNYLYDEEAVITIGDGQIGKVFHYINGKFDLHQRCYKMTNFTGLTGKYFYYFFSNNFYERAMKMTAKATVDSVRLEMISDMTIKYPYDVREQNKISSLLTNIDNLIIIQLRKFEKLQKIKKAFLQNMFI